MDNGPHKPHLCPWWLGFAIDNPLRRMLHDPEKILAPHAREGMRVVDIGCGMGIFTLGLAKLVGPSGSVLAVDMQQKMLDAVVRRSKEAGLAERVQTHCCAPDRLGVEGLFDFALSFYMLHETPSPRVMMESVFEILKEKGRWLVVEPRGHVSEAAFETMRATAGRVGFDAVGAPEISLSRAMLLEKPAELVLE